MKRKKIRHRSAVTDDGNKKRSQDTKNFCLPGASTVQQHPGIQPLQKEAVNTLWSSILRRQNHSTNQPENNCHKPAAQGTSGHQQDDSLRKTFLVAQIDGSHTTKTRQLHTMQTFR